MLNYDIYQLKEDSSLHSIRFANTRYMNSHNIPIDAGNYEKVYSGTVDNESAAGKKSTGEVLESLYEKFNLCHPADFRGHSLSVSDVVTLHDNGVVTAHYCDSYGFKQIPEFIQPDAFVNLDSSGIAVSGHYGTWHTLESHNIQGREYYLMESDAFGRDAANVIVDGTGRDDTLSHPEKITDRIAPDGERPSVIGRLKAAQEKISEKADTPKSPNKSGLTLNSFASTLA